MRDLTRDSIARHLVAMAAQIAISTFAQTACQLISLYFVAKTGAAVTAGVTAAGNAVLSINAFGQVLVTGTIALVAQALGRRDHEDANRIFNQAMILSLASGVLGAALLGLFVRAYLESLTVDVATVRAGVSFILWMLPGCALQMPMAVLSSSLRAAGIVRPATSAYVLTVLVNVALAPVLIGGWGTGVALGAAGAGLTTSISTTAGTAYLLMQFHLQQSQMAVTSRLLRPDFSKWLRMLGIGLPAAADSLLTFAFTTIAFNALRYLGPSVQAGFSIGLRMLQLMLLPAAIIALAAAPIAGQNFGAMHTTRVKETFQKAILIAGSLTLAVSTFALVQPRALVGVFTTDAQTLQVAAIFLQLVSWASLAQALVYVCSAMFQGLGNTVPSLVSSVTRLLVFAVMCNWLSTRTGFHVEQVWYVWVAAAVLQALVSLFFIRTEFRKRLVRPADS